MDQALSKKQRKKLILQEKQLQKEAQLQRKQKNQQRKNSQEIKASQKPVPSSSKQTCQSQHKISTPDNTNKNKKKQKQQQRRDNDQQKSSSSGQEEEEQNEELDFNRVLEDQENVQFSFSIAEINQKHYHSMKTILEKFARLTTVISSDWADAIVSNKGAGNVVIAEEAEDEDEEEQQQQDQQDNGEEDDEQNVCSGVINILPSTNKLTKKVCTKISQSIPSQTIRGSKKSSQLSQILSSNNCSLLICERAINLPAFIVKSMHEVLASDMSQLRKQDNKQYLKICGKYILGVSEVQIQKSKSKKKMEKGSDNVQDAEIDNIIFSRFEDYLFVQNSLGWWIGQSSPNAVRKVPLHRLFYVISSDKYFQSVNQIGSLLQQN